MKKRSIVGVALVLGMLVAGSAYAAGCGTCGEGGKCKDPQAVQQFRSETAALADELKAKDIELRNVYAMEAVDINRAGVLESELKELKARIHAVADKLGIPACCTA